MKLEINELEMLYRLVDGLEDTSGYVTGDVVSFGETAELHKDGEDEPWTAEIDDDGECDGSATQGGKSVSLGFELGCEFDEDEDTDPDEETTAP